MRIIEKPRDNFKRYALVLLALGFLLGSFLLYFKDNEVEAADATKFNPGNIIDDAVFYDYTTMTASDIQNFLNSKVSKCESGYTCLKDYSSDTVAKSADAYCSGYNASSSQTAAQIIYGVAQSCKINPQALLVILQKEMGLVTHTGPGSWRYKTAMGMGCPDTAACDSQYYGLFNQLYGAARQYRIYQAKPSSYNYVANRNNTILWNPSSSCGSSTVFIENQATAGLYNYTPYRPNQAALNAGYGTGNNCSSYGNRNFYLYFTDWFGSTTGPDYVWEEVSQKIYYTDDNKSTEIDYNNVPQGRYLYIEYTVKNIGRKTWPKGSVLLGRESDSPFCTNEWIACSRASVVNSKNEVKYGDSVTFGFWMRAPNISGKYSVYWNLLIENVAWFVDIGSHHNINIVSDTRSGSLDDQHNFIRRGDALYSSNGSSVLSLLSNGDLSVYYKGKRVYTVASGVYQLRQQSDGNLVAYSKNGTPIWVAGDGAKRQLTISDSGSLTYKKNSSDVGISIASWTVDSNNFESIYRDGIIVRNQSIKSDNKSYTLILQGDGNLVLYGPKGAIWATGNNRGSFLAQQGDGKLVLYDYNGSPVWSSSTWLENGTNTRTIMQGDGNLVTYDGYKAVWSTR